MLSEGRPGVDDKFFLRDGQSFFLFILPRSLGGVVG